MWLWRILILLTALAVGGCISGGSHGQSGDDQQGDRQVVDDATLDVDATVEAKVESTVAAKVDKSINTARISVWNDVRPWIYGGVVMTMIFAGAITVILVVWIRRNSYRVQKPQWERSKGMVDAGRRG